jgi:succinoglycan biosynthesis transport protein ExoP
VNRYLQTNKIIDEPTFDDAAIGSQIYIVSSESIVVPVVRSMNLAHDSEFVGPPKGDGGETSKLKEIAKQSIGWVKQSIGWTSGTTLDPDTLLERTAVEHFYRRLTVYREDVANVINVTFASEDPNKAASIANAVAETYIATTLEAKLHSTNIVSQWLQDRLKELKVQASDADRALQNYRIANNLVRTGASPLNSEQIANLNTQLINARIALAEVKARLDHIVQNGETITNTVMADVLLNNSGRAGTLSVALNNSDIVRLRSRYRELAERVADVESRVGPQHGVAVKLHAQMADLRKSIREEEQRIADSYANEYRIAKAREGEVAAAVSQSIGEAETNSQSQVTMRELESSAETLRNLYNSFLQKFKEINTIQTQTIPVENARILTSAAPQLQKNYMKPAAVLAGGLMFGLILGAGAALAREWAADVFRTPKKVEQVTNKACVVLPMVHAKREPGARLWSSAKSLSIEEFILDAPYSRFTESLRNIKALIDTGPRVEGAKVIGVVSSLAREGKTTIAANLAALMVASAGARTLVIDADLHRRLLTAALAPEARQGLIEALNDPSRLASLTFRRERSGLDVLPCALSARLPNAAELLGSVKMEQLLEVARKAYDYIIIEVAPIISVVDIKTIERFIDSFIFVVEWGLTKRSLVLEALSGTSNIRERVTGIVLNKTDPVALRSIEAYKSDRFRNYYEE